MKSTFLTTLLLFIALAISAQDEYNASAKYPYGRLNPEASKQTGDYAHLIGTNTCKSTQRNPDGSWQKTQDMKWIFKYILNGYAVQDEAIKADGNIGGSIRQFIADSSKWYVHYYNNQFPTPTLPAWAGEKKGDSMVLYNKQKAPNGMDGYYRITFGKISKEGFEWKGEWVDLTEKIVYPTWNISCTREESDE
ncbi:hypothetical protein POV27_15715 [Aureisphaera galaxeae]|uniref:hypothetical protein n=1 Tax=Aureisphaera galaxeae TaxID=1538023 RepID=UPI002350B4ED|nr:hypothetical protein [Aureisphaera galaxeae]MDC8005505.1 hypothetical protein [Aureisphaera galaxeae]